jgi:hypothetical protein
VRCIGHGRLLFGGRLDRANVAAIACALIHPTAKLFPAPNLFDRDQLAPMAARRPDRRRPETGFWKTTMAAPNPASVRGLRIPPVPQRTRCTIGGETSE